MKLVFAGTPEFACVALERLHAADHEIALVLTQPDRPGGRGMKLQPSSVKRFALEHDLALAQPRSLRRDGKYPQDALAARAALATAKADAMVVAAYGLILPQCVLDLPRLGGFNIHASLLPRWRGAAPIARAIEAGDAQTGISIMQMDAGLDTGAVLLQQALAIEAQDSARTLHDKLAALGAELMLTVLQQASVGGLQAVPQPQDGVTYARKIEKTEAPIDWQQSATVITQRIRAFDPFPAASSRIKNETIKVWSAHALAQTAASSVACGQILAITSSGIAVQAQGSVVNITQLQRPGGKRLAHADFLRGFELRTGMVFERTRAS